jgi:hypothetical protein
MKSLLLSIFLLCSIATIAGADGKISADPTLGTLAGTEFIPVIVPNGGGTFNNEKISTSILQPALGFTPENAANKSNATLNSSTTLYPTNNAAKSYVDGVASGLQPSLGFTAENVANKTNSALTNSTTLYPTSNAVMQYVNGVALGLVPKPSADAATIATLPAYTYSNGTLGVGATLTGTATGTLTVDGHLVALNDHILVKNEVSGNAPYNGLYLCTTAGASGVAYVLTRDTSTDQATEFSNSLIAIKNGSTLIGQIYLCTNFGTVTVGTTPITFLQLITSTSGVTTVGASSPVVSTGGTTPIISVPAATASVNGYMTSTYAAKVDGIAAGATANAKITGATLDALTDDTGFVTALAVQNGHKVPHVAPGTSGNVMVSDGTDWTSAVSAYTLPTATGSVLGGVKTGSGIVNTAGVISATASSVGAAGFGANTFSGTQNLNSNSISGIKTATFKTDAVITTTTGTINIDWSAASRYIQNALTGAVTYTFTSPSGPGHLQLKMLAPTTAQTVTWPSLTQLGATWAGANGKLSVINFDYDGTNYVMMGSNAP